MAEVRTRPDSRRLRRCRRLPTCALLAIAGCHSAQDTDLLVLAAASLGEGMAEIAIEFERANRGTRILTSYAGSQTLATQLREGAAADVIATANTAIMDDLEARGLVRSPHVFARNRMVWLVRLSAGLDAAALLNPGQLESSDWRIVLAAPEVPAGRYARDALDALGVRAEVEARLVSQEFDVRGVVSKIRLAGADAGIVYATDVLPEMQHEVRVVELPEHAGGRASYAVAVASGTAHPTRAERFVEFLQAETAQAILSGRGFSSP